MWARIVAGWRESLSLPQHVLIGHGDAGEHRADDAEVALVGAAEEEMVDVRRPRPALLRRAVDAAVDVAGEFSDGPRREHVGIDDGAAEIGEMSSRGCEDAVGPDRFPGRVIVVAEVHP